MRRVWFAGAFPFTVSACSLITGVGSLDESACPGDCGSSKDASADVPRDVETRMDVLTPEGSFPDVEADAPDSRSSDAFADVAADAPPDAAPPPPITFVQTRGSKATATSIALAFSSDVQEGNVLVVPFDFGTASGGVVADVTDTLGNTFYKVLGPYDGQGARQYIFYAVGAASGADAVTVTITVSSEIELYLHEYSGLAQTKTLDLGASALAMGTSDAVNGATAGPITTSSSNELVFAFATCNDSCAPGPGFIQRSAFDGNCTEDEIAKAPGAYTAVATAMNGGWVMSVFALHGL
jgi:hypothetical protein